MCQRAASKLNSRVDQTDVTYLLELSFIQIKKDIIAQIIVQYNFIVSEYEESP